MLSICSSCKKQNRAQNNSPCSIYQNSHMVPQLSAKHLHLVFFVSSLWWKYLPHKGILENWPFWAESLRFVVEFWYIEHELLIKPHFFMVTEIITTILSINSWITSKSSPICPTNSIFIPWCSSFFPGTFRFTLTYSKKQYYMNTSQSQLQWHSHQEL